MEEALHAATGFTVTGTTVLRGVDAAELIGWGGAMLSDSALRALVLVPQKSMLIIDNEIFNVGLGECNTGTLTIVRVIEELQIPHRRLLGIRTGDFKHLGVVCAVESGGARGLRYTAFYLGSFPCCLGYYYNKEDAVTRIQQYTCTQ